MLNVNYWRAILISVFFLLPTISFSRPPDNTVRGKLVFLGKTNDLSSSVWLSITTAGAFELEAQGHQVIDTWDMSARGTHLSLSPIVSQGNGGTHFLINRENNRKLDSQNQQGGVIFPPLPSEPPSVMPPIAIYPEHPIVIPPVTPPEVTNPIPPVPQHPIVIPPGTPPGETNPIPSTPEHPLASATSAANQTGAAQDEYAIDVNQPAPITKARQFDQGKAWNIWSDNYYFNTRDGRNGLDAKGATTDFVIGADRRIATNVVLGGLLSFLKYNYAAINNNLINHSSGFNIGPYIGYSISRKWSVNSSLTYGQLQNNNEIASLNSHYNTQMFHGDFRATGLFQCGNFQLRPKPLISFTHFRNPDYQFNGMFRNRSFQVNRNSESFNFNFAELRLEGNYTLETSKGNIVQPYIEPGIDYAFSRPNDGQVLTGNLTLAHTIPVTETLTAGVRALLSKAFLIDTSGSYLSFGQHGLDVWELRLLASYSFG